MQFLTLDKNFVLDNFSFVQDKKYFVRAEGRGITHIFCTTIFGQFFLHNRTMGASLSEYSYKLVIKIRKLKGALTNCSVLSVQQLGDEIFMAES